MGIVDEILVLERERSQALRRVKELEGELVAEKRLNRDFRKLLGMRVGVAMEAICEPLVAIRFKAELHLDQAAALSSSTERTRLYEECLRSVLMEAAANFVAGCGDGFIAIPREFRAGAA